MDVYHNFENVVLEILQFFKELIDHQNPFLNTKQSKRVYNICLESIKVYRRYNHGKVNSTLKSTAEEEKYEAVLCLLEMMTHLTSKDFIDFSSGMLCIVITNCYRFWYTNQGRQWHVDSITSCHSRSYHGFAIDYTRYSRCTYIIVTDNISFPNCASNTLPFLVLWWKCTQKRWLYYQHHYFNN